MEEEKEKEHIAVEEARCWAMPLTMIWVWVQMKPPGYGQRGLALVLICHGLILGVCFLTQTHGGTDCSIAFWFSLVEDAEVDTVEGHGQNY